MSKIISIAIFVLFSCAKHDETGEKSPSFAGKVSAVDPTNPEGSGVVSAGEIQDTSVPIPEGVCRSNKIGRYSARLVASNQMVVVYSACGLAVSRDRGLSFTQVKDLGFGEYYYRPGTSSPELGDSNFVGRVALSGESIYASQNVRVQGDPRPGHIAISSDFGASWRNIGILRDIQEFRVSNFHLFAINGSNGLFAYRLGDSSFMGLIESCHWSSGPYYCRPVSKSENEIDVKRTEISVGMSYNEIESYGDNVFVNILDGAWVNASVDDGKTFQSVKEKINLKNPYFYAFDMGAIAMKSIGSDRVVFLKTPDLIASEIVVKGVAIAAASDSQFVYILYSSSIEEEGPKFNLRRIEKKSL